MLKAPIPPNDEQRVESLRSMKVLDTLPEERFDSITKYLSQKLNVPICTVSLIDVDREWFKSNVGYPSKESSRTNSFCGHTIFVKDMFIVEDTTKDPRFADNPSVVGPPFIRFYAGVALYNRKDRMPIGALCVKDFVPKKLSLADIDALLLAAGRVEDELNKDIK